MKKRVIALALCLVMLATCLGAGMLAPTPVKLVDENGAAATSAAVPQLGRKTLTASYADATETTGYQWQFSNDGDTWIDIYGETAQTCSLSYAKVKNMLDADGKAQLRCVVTDGEDERVSSAATVTVDYSAQTAEAATEAQSGVSVMAAPARAASYARSAEPQSDDATCSVMIKYEFADGTQAANPWTATIAKGSSINQSVTSPTVLGYAPDQAEVVVNVTDIQENKTYTVRYSPALVEFTVKHYQQNVSNDYYTLSDTVTTKGFTESAVGEDLAINYEGFYSLLYDTSTPIAADGSTVVEIYYDRYYCLMSFDLDGGYGVEPIYARYGATIGDVGTPTKAGYSFDGWSLDGTNTVDLPTDMPAKNRTYKAVWTPDDTAKVTVVFWGENADDKEYSYIRSMQVDATPGKSYSYDGSTLTCPLAEHSHGTGKCTLNCTHVHTLDCYSTYYDDFVETTKPTAGLTDQGNGIYTYTTGSWSSTTHYYLNIGDKWYCGTDWWGDEDDKQSISFDCKHTHADACYSCGKTEHTHSSACSGLWTFVKSDTVTVAADGSSVVNVYYARTEFTLTFKDGNKTVATITDKWGADIHTKFPIVGTNGTTYKGTMWRVPSGCQTFTAGTNVLSIDTMPSENITFTNKGKDASATLYYYVESLDGTGTHNYNGKNYDLYKTVYLPASGRLTESEEFHEIIGFKKGDYYPSTIFNQVSKEMYLYYTRNSFDIVFYNPTELIYTEENVPYQKNLSSYVYTPTPNQAPAKYEPGSVEFEGWYLNPECSGQKFDFSSHTMPAGPTNTNGEVALSLYAKWVPVTHTVKTWLTDEMTTPVNVGDTVSNEQTVPHGSTATEPAEPENGKYTFVGWFYKENGVEKAFDFSMPVNRDLNLYAKWSSNTLMEYTIRYELENGTEIAPPTTGSALAGTTKTFNAKTGTELNEGYQSGYFPKVSSHSITMDIEDASKNEFTFVYVAKEEVRYTVRYLDKTTGKPVVVDGVPTPDKEVKTRDAVVTETFKQIKGYAPDAYQKQLVLAAENNEIIFWYTKDNVHAPVQIIHWIQNIAGDGYTEYQSSTNLNGVIGKPYSETPLTIAGFEYNSDKSNAGGELTEAGLVLNLYYDRVEYPYEFRFLEQGTNEVLESSVTGTARYQAQVTQRAKTIPGYKLVSEENQAINIAIEDPAETANKNVRVFYYTENEVTINYVAVGPDGVTDFGSVNPTSETVKVLTGTAQGSTATASSKTYRFVGWYDNEACTGTALSTKATYVPQKGSDGIYAAATYYAKFEYNLTNLTITKKASPYDANDMFIFTVKHGDEVVAKVTLKAGESVTIKDLTIGETYTVTEDTSWSWRYKNVEAQEITLQSTNNKVTVTNTLDNNNWLGASSYAINRCVDSVVTRVVDAVKSIFDN